MHAPASLPRLTWLSTLAKAGFALCTAALIMLLGQMMASELPNAAPEPVATPTAIATGAVRPATAQSSSSTVPASLADLNGGSRGFPAESLTVNQHL